MSEKESVIDIVRRTYLVDGEGNVSFRCRTGRGSGKAVEIPHDQLKEFSALISETVESLNALTGTDTTNENE